MFAPTPKQQAAISSQRVQGRVWKYGDGVNTDVIFPKSAPRPTQPAGLFEYQLAGQP
jgi:3-isopropylmalate dehydratase small subunit